MKKRNVKNKSNRKSTWRLVVIVMVQILLMATAWTVCVVAPMPYKIIIPVTLGTLSIIIHACTYFAIARGKKK